MGAGLQMFQAWPVVSPSSKLYKVYTMFFHRNRGAKFGITNCRSQFSKLVQTNSNVKLTNGIMGHAQVTEIILCSFNNCSIIYPVVPVYYFIGDPSNNISLCTLKWYVGFQKDTPEPLEFSYPVISRSATWMNRFRLYPTNDI